MALVSVAAQNASLSFSYGATKAASAPATFELALFAGDPATTGTELAATGGYARVTVTNNGTNFPAPADGQLTGAFQAFPVSTAAWSGVASHWALIDAATDDIWDADALEEEIVVDAAGATPSVRPVIYYGPPA